MRIAEVIGTVTLTRKVASFEGARLKLAVPLKLENLTGEQSPQADALVVWDDLGVGMGQRMAISEGGEAAQPFYPEAKPVDAYNAAILDQIDIRIADSDDE